MAGQGYDRHGSMAGPPGRVADRVQARGYQPTQHEAQQGAARRGAGKGQGVNERVLYQGLRRGMERKRMVGAA